VEQRVPVLPRGHRPPRRRPSGIERWTTSATRWRTQVEGRLLGPYRGRTPHPVAAAGRCEAAIARPVAALTLPPGYGQNCRSRSSPDWSVRRSGQGRPARTADAWCESRAMCAARPGRFRDDAKAASPRRSSCRKVTSHLGRPVREPATRHRTPWPWGGGGPHALGLSFLLWGSPPFGSVRQGRSVAAHQHPRSALNRRRVSRCGSAASNLSVPASVGFIDLRRPIA